MVTYAELTKMVERHNGMGVAQIQVVLSNSNRKLVDIYRNGQVLLLSKTYERANDIIEALAKAQKQNAEFELLRFEKMLATAHEFHWNEENIKAIEEDIETLKNIINAFVG